MKRKPFLFALLLAALPLRTLAYDFSAVAPSGQTLYYNIVNGEAQVTYPGSSDIFWPNTFAKPSGDLIIPASVTHGGTTYAVTSIGEMAFIASSLTSVKIPNSVTSIGACAFIANVYNLTSIELPNSVTSIGEYAFQYCGSLTSINIPNQLTTIERGAFYGCRGLTSIEIPKSVTHIGDYAFSAGGTLTALGEIRFRGQAPPTFGTGVFDYHSANLSVFVPCGKRTAYASALPQFSNFSEVMTLDFAAVPDDAVHGQVDTLAFPTCAQPTVSFSATAQPGYRFYRWSDGSRENPRTISLVSDTAIVAHFEAVVYDTVYVHDTTVVRDTIVVHDTTVVHDTMVAYLVHVSDTALVTRHLHDSTVVNNTYYDTFYVFTHAVDTMHILDTMIVNHFRYDTVIRNVYQYDTTIVNNYAFDTTVYNSFRFDTTLVFDTVIVNVYSFDTSIYNRYQFDTTVVNVYSTIPSASTPRWCLIQ